MKNPYENFSDEVSNTNRSVEVKEVELHDFLKVIDSRLDLTEHD
jgi:hypothetical protein